MSSKKTRSHRPKILPISPKHLVTRILQVWASQNQNRRTWLTGPPSPHTPAKTGPVTIPVECWLEAALVFGGRGCCSDGICFWMTDDNERMKNGRAAGSELKAPISRGSKEVRGSFWLYVLLQLSFHQNILFILHLVSETNILLIILMSPVTFSGWNIFWTPLKNISVQFLDFFVKAHHPAFIWNIRAVWIQFYQHGDLEIKMVEHVWCFYKLNSGFDSLEPHRDGSSFL